MILMVAQESGGSRGCRVPMSAHFGLRSSREPIQASTLRALGAPDVQQDPEGLNKCLAELSPQSSSRNEESFGRLGNGEKRHASASWEGKASNRTKGCTAWSSAAATELPTLRAMAAADIHNLVLQLGGDVRIIPATVKGVDA